MAFSHTGVSEFRALGVMLDRHASTPAMVRHRALEVQKVWGRLRRLLLCKHIPQVGRLYSL